MSHTPAVSRRRRLADVSRVSSSTTCSPCRSAAPPRCSGPTRFADSYFRFAHATAFVVNDVGMVFFFALITKEVAEATMPGGALHPWRRAALPVAAAIGSVVVSIAGYLAFVQNAR